MRSPLAKKIRTVAISSLATAALSIPAVSAVSVTAHDAGKRVVTPSSHRLALTLKPASVRLT
jgi:hypothetical protein